MDLTVNAKDRANTIADLIGLLTYYNEKLPDANIDITTYEYPDSRQWGRYVLDITWEETR